MDFFLSIINSIKVGDKMLENSVFKNYDKISNSIWDKAEIQTLQNDISKFIGEDGNPDSLSETELNNYKKDLLSNAYNEKDKSLIKDFFNNIQVFKKCSFASYKDLLLLNSFHSQDLDRILRELENFQIIASEDKKLQILSYKEGMDYNFTFNKKGLIEYSTKENDEWTEKPFSKKFINEHIEDKEKDIILDIINRRYDSNDWSKYDIEKMEIKQKDRTISIIKDENGFYSIQEIKPNNEVNILQKVEFNNETAVSITTRATTSPEGIQSEFKQELSDISQSLSYRITDINGNVILDKQSMLILKSDSPEIYSYQITEFNKIQNFEVQINENSIRIKNIDNELEHIINLSDYIKNSDNIGFFMNILKKVPANQLYLISPEKLNELIKDSCLYDGGCRSNEEKFDIEIGSYDDNLSYFNTFMHEYGHYIDNLSGNIGNNIELKEIYKLEYENFVKNTTTKEQKILEHIVNEYYYNEDCNLSECVAETNALLNAGLTTAPGQLRLYYYQKYFPRTICKIEELIFNATQN